MNTFNCGCDKNFSAVDLVDVDLTLPAYSPTQDTLSILINRHFFLLVTHLSRSLPFRSFYPFHRATKVLPCHRSRIQICLPPSHLNFRIQILSQSPVWMFVCHLSFVQSHQSFPVISSNPPSTLFHFEPWPILLQSPPPNAVATYHHVTPHHQLTHQLEAFLSGPQVHRAIFNSMLCSLVFRPWLHQMSG